MPRREIFYGTNNPGKRREVSEFAALFGYEIVTPHNLGLRLDPPETGATLEENATLKVRAWREELPDHLIMTDDTGLEIEALGGEPGIKVRRWKDGTTEMTDDEIVAYALERLSGVPQGERAAVARTVVALQRPDGELKLFDGTLPGYILEEPTPQVLPGFPLERIHYVTEWGMPLGAHRQMSAEETKELPTHRTKAVKKALDYLASHEA